MKIAVVERLNLDGTSYKIDYITIKTKFGYDLLSLEDKMIHYCVRELEPQYLGDSSYLVDLLEVENDSII